MYPRQYLCIDKRSICEALYNLQITFAFCFLNSQSKTFWPRNLLSRVEGGLTTPIPVTAVTYIYKTTIHTLAHTRGGVEVSEPSTI